VTLRAYLTLGYLMVALVFACLLGSSAEWRRAAGANKRHGVPSWLGFLIQIATLAGFGCVWPAVMIYWLFT
jgi:hypothetical protein